MSPDKAKISARRWLIGAAGITVAGVLTYYGWRPGWEVFDVWFNGGAWWCIAQWSHERGFIRGWTAGRKTDA